VAWVLVVWFRGVFEVGEDFVYGYAGEVGGEEFGFLLRVAVGSVGLVGGLDALLWVGLVVSVLQEERSGDSWRLERERRSIRTGSLLHASIRPS
jgi:hypothetical protein